jgi:hypothetical protein
VERMCLSTSSTSLGPVHTSSRAWIYTTFVTLTINLPVCVRACVRACVGVRMRVRFVVVAV